MTNVVTFGQSFTRWRARKGYNQESQSLKRLIVVTKSKLEPTKQTFLDTINDIFQKPQGKTSKVKVNTNKGEVQTAKQVVELRVREMLVDW